VEFTLKINGSKVEKITLEYERCGFSGAAGQKSAGEISLETSRLKVTSIAWEFSLGNFPLCFYSKRAILWVRSLKLFQQFWGLDYLIGGDGSDP
jgi:hypothetical protein